MCLHYLSSVSVAEWPPFKEIAAHSVDNMFSRILTIFNITHVVIPRFGFEGWIKILMATVPDICILFEMPRCQGSANAVKAQCERRDSTVHAM